MAACNPRSPLGVPLRHSSKGLTHPEDSASDQASRSAAPRLAGGLPPALAPVAASTSHTGHGAGGHDVQSRPSAEVTSPRPRAPHSLPPAAVSRPTSFTKEREGAPSTRRAQRVKRCRSCRDNELICRRFPLHPSLPPRWRVQKIVRIKDSSLLKVFVYVVVGAVLGGRLCRNVKPAQAWPFVRDASFNSVALLPRIARAYAARWQQIGAQYGGRSFSRKKGRWQTQEPTSIVPN
jgi:hypothetical protein